MDGKMRKRVFYLLVEDTPGTLSRIAGLFSRRGYNINSVSVGDTEDTGYSRLTVVATGDDLILEQIEKQLRKLEVVKEIKQLKNSSSVRRELILVKIKVDAKQRQSILSLTDIFRAKIVDVAPDSLIVEMTGTQEKLDAFLLLLEDYEVMELVKTGITAMERGHESNSDPDFIPQ